MKRQICSLILLCALAAFARADPRENVTFTSVFSNGALNASTNSVRTASFIGDYTVTRVRVSGTLTKLNTSTFAREARIQVTPPTGPAFILQPFTIGSFSGSISTSSYVFTLTTPISPASGTWIFRFHEAYDDTGNDSRWDTITFTLDDGIPPPPPALDLGTLRSPVTLARSFSVTPGLVQWYRLDLPDGVTAAGLRYLDLDTGGSVIGAGDDTEMALYASTGIRVAEDDDDGPGNTSMLSFGTGARAGDSQGQDGELAPGVYYLALAGFDATFNPGYSVFTTNPSVGTISLHVSYFPTPLEITGVTPTEARAGDLVTLTGRGFGTRTADLAALVSQPDGTSIPLRIESVTDTSLVVRLGAVRQGAQPGSIQVWRGTGGAGAVVPALGAIVPEAPYAVAALDTLRGPLATSSPTPLVVIPSPAVVPGWRYSTLESGAVSLAVSDSWPQNSTVSGIMYIQTESGVRSFIEFPATRIRLAGAPLLSAQRLADLITATYAQRLPGVFVACEAVSQGGGAILRVRGRDTVGGSSVGVALGALDIWVTTPVFVETLSGLSVSAFGGASASRLGDEVHIANASATGGATIDADESAYGLGAALSPVDLSASNSAVTFGVWGDRLQHPNETVFRVTAANGGVGQPLSISTWLPSQAGTTIRVQVYLGGALVGEADAPASEPVFARRPVSGVPRIANAGFSTQDVPAGWVGFEVPATVRRGDTEWTGDQLRILVPGLTDIVAAVEALDIMTSGVPALVIRDASTLSLPLPCPADFNEDGGIDGTDIGAFFAAWEAGSESSDVNGDGGIDGADPVVFFAAWEAGGCPP